MSLPFSYVLNLECAGVDLPPVSGNQHSWKVGPLMLFLKVKKITGSVGLPFPVRIAESNGVNPRP